MNYKPKKYVLIQARTNSSRLFGKCIFYIKNKELISLLYSRVKSIGYETVILTSNQKSDDYLCTILKKKNIKFFRGNLNNVRNRFLQYTSNLNKEDIIVRCTGDNLFIDKFIIKDLINRFEKSKKNYLSINRKKSMLPYGLVAEVFTVGALRSSKAINKMDLEHVTPPLIRLKKDIEFSIIENKFNLYNKSCTLDTLYDYFKIKYIFENYNNNTKTKWYKLCKDLNKVNKKIIEKKIKEKFDKIILGTAQLGFQYGINNQNKKIKKKDITDILNFAKKNYINYLDTAEGYKSSEKRIGEYCKNYKSSFNIITKFNTNKLSKIRLSLKKLNLKKIFSVLIHNPSQIKNRFDVINIKKILSKYKSNISFIGASINSPKEYLFLKKHKFFKIFQIPYNILDIRWNKLLKNKKKSIEIHARSIFLQGLLITDQKNCPSKLKKEFNIVIKKLSYLRKKLNRFDEKDLLFSYVNKNSNIKKIVIGIENIDQIAQIPFYLLRKDLTNSDMRLVKRKMPKVSNDFLTPSNW
jgi:spore coat polysaccharide biosynthesis protein SpsF (cytidylyltransferase family)/aryl-alcohol dehydrogenase-like predicted oxidoreductase